MAVDWEAFEAAKHDAARAIVRMRNANVGDALITETLAELHREAIDVKNAMHDIIDQVINNM